MTGSDLLRQRVFWDWYYRVRELPEAPQRFILFEGERIVVPGGTGDFIFNPEEDVVQFERRLLGDRSEITIAFKGGFTWRIRCQDLGGAADADGLAFDDTGAWDASDGFTRGAELSWSDAKSIAFVPDTGFGWLEFNEFPLTRVVKATGGKTPGLLALRTAGRW